MSKLEKERVLFTYIVVASHAVSFVLVKVENGVQKPVYYVTKSLQEAKVRYIPLEKAILAIMHATRKLLHHFQAHTVVVLTQLPLQSLLRKSDYTGRVTKWGTILGAFDIKYMPCIVVIKVLADLVAEFTKSPIRVGAKEQGFGGEQVLTVSPHGYSPWKLYVNGVANQKGSGVGVG